LTDDWLQSTVLEIQRWLSFRQAIVLLDWLVTANWG
jgi:hypothetical protein